MTEAQFKARYPQFATNANVATYLTESLLFIGEAYEELTDYAQGLYVAHHCALEAEERARATSAPGAVWDGAIVSKSAGRLSVSRSGAIVDKQADDDLYRTTYGQRLRKIRDEVGHGMIAAGAKWLDDDGTGLCSPDTLKIPGEDGDLF